MAIPANAKKFLKKAGEYVTLLVVFGGLGTLWINTEVERRMGELASDPASSPAVVTLKAEVDNLEDGQARIEKKVDAFSEEFLKYLARQAQ